MKRAWWWYAAAVALLVYWELRGSGVGSVSDVVDTVSDAATKLVNGIPQSKIDALSNAIATAEGYFVPGTVPNRANNPGDLVLGDVGYGTLGAGITVFPDAETGWAKLKHQVLLMLTGQSHIYSPSDSIAYVASKYTQTEQSSWAANVAAVLGLSTGDTLEDFLNV